MSSRKFQNALILLTVVVLAAAMWWNFTIPMTLGLFALIVIMSWASIIDRLLKRSKNEQRSTNSKRSD
jgi:hypothetical protein